MSEELEQNVNGVKNPLNRGLRFGEVQYKTQATVKIVTPRPIHIVAISDVYYGSKYCNEDELSRHINIVEQIPGAYIVLLGNLVANPTHRMKTTDKVHPDDQAEFMQDLIKRLDSKRKIIGAVRSHYVSEGKVLSGIQVSDDKYDIEGEDIKREEINNRLFAGVSFPVLINGGILGINLRVPDAKDDLSPTNYKLALFSKTGPYKSYLNKSHSLVREYELSLGGEVDAVIGAFQRVGAITHRYVGHPPDRANFVAINAGTYRGNITGEDDELTDQRMRDQSARDGEPSGEALTLSPTTREMMMHLTPDALAHYHAVNSLYLDVEEIAQAGVLDQFWQREGVKRLRLPKQPLEHVLQVIDGDIKPNLSIQNMYVREVERRRRR